MSCTTEPGMAAPELSVTAPCTEELTPWAVSGTTAATRSNAKSAVITRDLSFILILQKVCSRGKPPCEEAACRVALCDAFSFQSRIWVSICSNRRVLGFFRAPAKPAHDLCNGLH